MPLVEVGVRRAGTSGAERGAYAVVTLCDPDRRNVLSGEMVREIVAAFDRLESATDPAVGAIVVTGAGRAFCAGADLAGLEAARPGGAPSAGEHREAGAGLRAIYEGFLRVARCPLPTIAAVNGPAVGAGMNLALSCDVRLVGERGRFECRFAELGLHPGGGHTWLLHRAVGPEAAAAMLLFNEVLTGEEAVRRGLAWSSVPGEELLEAAGELAASAAAVPPELSRRIKQSLARAAGLASHSDAVDAELDAQLWSVRQPFFAERLAAMRDRIATRSRPG
ncbi:MAG TPA: enoyl-CoA hydratase [Acidimicrobiales bacterium]|nr:enoyl-CoA hydratase [Acidimicrobiales bacterium]